MHSHHTHRNHWQKEQFMDIVLDQLTSILIAGYIIIFDTEFVGIPTDRYRSHIDFRIWTESFCTMRVQSCNWLLRYTFLQRPIQLMSLEATVHQSTCIPIRGGMKKMINGFATDWPPRDFFSECCDMCWKCGLTVPMLDRILHIFFHAFLFLFFVFCWHETSSRSRSDMQWIFMHVIFWCDDWEKLKSAFLYAPF